MGISDGSVAPVTPPLEDASNDAPREMIILGRSFLP